MSAPSIAAQAVAVQRAAVNLRGHVNNLSTLVERKRRTEHELNMAAAWLPDLEAAAKTMEWFKANETAIRAWTERKAHS